MWIREEKEGGRERGMEREGGQKQLRGRRGWLRGPIFLCWPFRPVMCLYIWAWSYLVHCFPFWPSCILSFYIICFLSYHSFILLQVLKSSLVFGSPCGLFCPLWGLFQATVGRQPVVPPQELTAGSHEHDLTHQGSAPEGKHFLFWIKKKCSE